LQAVKETQKAILDRAMIVPIYSPFTLAAVAKKVQNFKLDPLLAPTFNDITLS
jgi:ABC-type transport system substrate-binding protein